MVCYTFFLIPESWGMSLEIHITLFPHMNRRYWSIPQCSTIFHVTLAKSTFEYFNISWDHLSFSLPLMGYLLIALSSCGRLSVNGWCNLSAMCDADFIKWFNSSYSMLRPTQHMRGNRGESEHTVYTVYRVTPSLDPNTHTHPRLERDKLPTRVHVCTAGPGRGYTVEWPAPVRYIVSFTAVGLCST